MNTGCASLLSESHRVTLALSAAYYSSPLGITNLHYPPYQSLTNDPTNHAYYAAYQFMTHAPMIHMHYVIAYAHLASIYSSHASPPLFRAQCNDLSIFLVMHPFLPMLLLIPLAQQLVQALPIVDSAWLHCLSITYQFLTKHLVICAYRATAPPVYKPVAKGCKEVSSSPSIKWPHSLTLSVYKLYLCLWTCRSPSAGLKLHYCCLSDISCIWSVL